MARTPNYAGQLRKVIAALEHIVAALESHGKTASLKTNGHSIPGRTRRSKKEVAALKKLLKSERKAGVPVAELASKHGVSSAYIYMLR